MKPFTGIFPPNSYLILSTNPNGSLLDHVCDSPNTSLLYTLSYVWRNPILILQGLNPLPFFVFIKISK